MKGRRCGLRSRRWRPVVSSSSVASHGSGKVSRIDCTVYGVSAVFRSVIRWWSSPVGPTRSSSCAARRASGSASERSARWSLDWTAATSNRALNPAPSRCPSRPGVLSHPVAGVGHERQPRRADRDHLRRAADGRRQPVRPATRGTSPRATRPSARSREWVGDPDRGRHWCRRGAGAGPDQAWTVCFGSSWCLHDERPFAEVSWISSNTEVIRAARGYCRRWRGEMMRLSCQDETIIEESAC